MHGIQVTKTSYEEILSHSQMSLVSTFLNIQRKKKKKMVMSGYKHGATLF